MDESDGRVGEYVAFCRMQRITGVFLMQIKNHDIQPLLVALRHLGNEGTHDAP